MNLNYGIGELKSEASATPYKCYLSCKYMREIGLGIFSKVVTYHIVCRTTISHSTNQTIVVISIKIISPCGVHSRSYFPYEVWSRKVLISKNITQYGAATASFKFAYKFVIGVRCKKYCLRSYFASTCRWNIQCDCRRQNI